MVLSRKITFISSIMLTVALLEFPSQYTYSYNVLQSWEMLGQNAPIFSAVFFAWISSVFFFVYTSKSKAGRIELLASNLLVVVFTGFWTLRTNSPIPKVDGTQAFSFISAVLSHGHLVLTNSYQWSLYTVWPLPTYFVSATSRIMGMGLDQTMIVTILILDQATCTLLFLFFCRVLGSPKLGFTALCIFWVGGIYNQSSTFTPTVYGFPLLVGLLLVTIGVFQSRRGTLRILPIFVILSIALALGHFISALMFLGIIMIVALAMARQTRIMIYGAVVAMLTVAVPVAYSELEVNFLASSIKGILQNPFLQFHEAYISKIGSQLPQWVSSITLGWQIVMIIPVVSAVFVVLVMRESLPRNIYFVCLMAIGLVLSGSFLVLGGVGYALSILGYLPLVSAPVIVALVSRHSQYRQFGLILVVALLVGASFPTFIAYNRTQELYQVNEYDLSLYKFIQSSVPGSGVTLYTSWDNYLPYVNNFSLVYIDLSPTATPASLWYQWNTTLNQFANAGSQTRVMLFSERDIVPWEAQIGVKSSDPHWNTIRGDLAAFDKVFVNRYGALYV